MKNTNYFKGKKVTVVGLARSGIACANLLYALGAEVTVTDSQDNGLTRANAAKLKLMVRLRSPLTLSEVEGSKNIKTELGRHSPDFIKGRDLLVVSPGVSNESPAMQLAKKFNVPAISEIEAGWILCPACVIAVTGTNGKTTVTTLIGKVLEEAGRRVFICGNIGNPFCAEVEKMREGDFVSLEVSSFQLETIKNFKPKISVLLNLSRNHLDRYKDMQEYLEVKKRIFMNQDEEDYLVLNSGDPLLKALGEEEARPKVVYFSSDENLNPHTNGGGMGVNPNQAAVLAVGSILGIDKKIIFKVFKEFKGVEHRMEFVAEINRIRFLNDSKSTTVDSTAWALKNINEPVILIAGGREKGNDYSLIADLIRQKVKKTILIGEAKDKIRREFRDISSVSEAATLPEAVKIAFQSGACGDCILFSPMCKSFDMFSNFEERGRVFKQAVYDLVNKVTNSY